MYTAEIIFELNDPSSFEKAHDIFSGYLGALRMNGQILGREFPAIKRDNSLISYVFIPDSNSLTGWFSNKYVRDSLDKCAKNHIHPSSRIVGKEFESAPPCTCVSRDSYILYTHYIAMETPLRCGDCFGTVPLYTVPKTYHDEYYDIICWESDYQACDTLQMHCRTGERFGLKQMEDFNSSLTKNGLEICGRISQLTGKKTYYSLYRYRNNPSMRKELARKCPSCGGEWLLEERLFNLFDFKCEKCSLLSNISPPLER